MKLILFLWSLGITNRSWNLIGIIFLQKETTKYIALTRVLEWRGLKSKKLLYYEAKKGPSHFMEFSKPKPINHYVKSEWIFFFEIHTNQKKITQTIQFQEKVILYHFNNLVIFSKNYTTFALGTYEISRLCKFGTISYLLFSQMERYHDPFEFSSSKFVYPFDALFSMSLELNSKRNEIFFHFKSLNIFKTKKKMISTRYPMLFFSPVKYTQKPALKSV